MTVEEELRTAYANLKGHQDRSLEYIRLIDEMKAEIEDLRKRLRAKRHTPMSDEGRRGVVVVS